MDMVTIPSEGFISFNWELAKHSNTEKLLFSVLKHSSMCRIKLHNYSVQYLTECAKYVNNLRFIKVYFSIDGQLKHSCSMSERLDVSKKSVPFFIYSGKT